MFYFYTIIKINLKNITYICIVYNNDSYSNDIIYSIQLCILYIQCILYFLFLGGILRIY